MKLIKSLTLLVLLAHQSLALVMYDSLVASSCIYYLNQLDWGCGMKGNSMKAYKCRCPNVEWLGTVTNCIYEHGNSTKEIHHAYKHIITRCQQKAHISYSLDQMISWRDNATNYLREVENSDFYVAGSSVPIGQPVEVLESGFHYYYSSFDQWMTWISQCQKIGWGCVGFWFAVLGLQGLAHFSNLLPNPFNVKSMMPKKLRKLVLKYISIPKVPYSGGLTVFEFIVSAAFTLLIVLACCINYGVSTNPYLTKQYFLTLDLISFRTDIIAFSLMPVIYVMGIRNNPLQYLCGVTHSTMIKYHKVTAALFVILAFIHSVIWTVWAVKDGGYNSWVEWYWIWGIVGTVLVSLMLVQSLKFIRNAMYEIFLAIHQAFSILLIISMWYHCRTLGWMGWVYAIAAVLSWDRFWRIARLIANGGVITAKIDNYDNKFLKLEFPKPKFFKFYSGSYIYLHFASPWYMCWQSHPFSLVKSVEADGNLVVFLKCKRGLTKQLINVANKAPTVKMLMDGPYGTFPLPQLKDKEIPRLISIGGGLGVTSVLPMFQRLDVELVNHKLIWLINDLSHLGYLKDSLQLLCDKGLEVDIYYTKGNQADDKSIDGSSLSDDGATPKGSVTEKHVALQMDDVSDVTRYKIHYFRPDLEKLLTETITSKENDNYLMDTKVYCCGPEPLNNQVRKVICKLIDLKEDREIEFEVENHEW